MTAYNNLFISWEKYCKVSNDVKACELQNIMIEKKWKFITDQ